MHARLHTFPSAAIMQHHTTTSKEETKIDVLTSARLEVLLVIWRIREALQAMPQEPCELTLRRWNHGIARELVSCCYLFDSQINCDC